MKALRINPVSSFKTVRRAAASVGLSAVLWNRRLRLQVVQGSAVLSSSET